MSRPSLGRGPARSERSARHFFAALFAALTVLVLISGCDEKKEKKQVTLGVTEWLDACSPFESFDGAQMLIFKISNHSVELSEATGDEREDGALMAKHPQKTAGAWTADDATKKVTLQLGEATTTYLLVIPFSEDVCILSHGSTEAVDLHKSWFGTPDFSEN